MACAKLGEENIVNSLIVREPHATIPMNNYGGYTRATNMLVIWTEGKRNICLSVITCQMIQLDIYVLLHQFVQSFPRIQ